jgi:RHS repeat-associated protein
LPIPSTLSSVTTTYGYTNGMETSIDTSANDGSSNLLGFSLTRDGDGNVLTSTPKVGSVTGPTDTYTYDSLSRVASGPIVGSSGSSAYAYNASNGITSDTTNFASSSYSNSGELCWSLATTSSNACSSPPSGSTIYTYDASGDRLSVTPSTGSDESLGWNQESGQLVCVNTDGSTCSTASPTSTTTLYAYDGNGMRTSSTYEGVVTPFTWDGLNDRVISDGNSDYVYGLDQSQPILQITADGSTPVVDLLCQDSNENIRGFVQLSGGTTSYNDSLVSYVDYDAYGNAITQSGGSLVTGGLSAETGGYIYSTTGEGFGDSFLDQTGLDYLESRYFDPVSSQFVSMDPLVQSTGQPYDYAGDNPISSSDPSGQSRVGFGPPPNQPVPHTCWSNPTNLCYAGLEFFGGTAAGDPMIGSLDVSRKVGGNGQDPLDFAYAPACVWPYSHGDKSGLPWVSVSSRIETCFGQMTNFIPQWLAGRDADLEFTKEPWWQQAMDAVSVITLFIPGAEEEGGVWWATRLGIEAAAFGISVWNSYRCFANSPIEQNGFDACWLTLDFLLVPALSDDLDGWTSLSSIGIRKAAVAIGETLKAADTVFAIGSGFGSMFTIRSSYSPHY